MIAKFSFRVRKDGIPYKGECLCRTPELIENYDKAISDTTQVWECHHKLESCFTKKFLKDMGLYYDVPPMALIFLTKEEHYKQKHAGNSLSKMGKHRSDETKKRISNTIKYKTSAKESKL